MIDTDGILAYLGNRPGHARQDSNQQLAPRLRHRGAQQVHPAIESMGARVKDARHSDGAVVVGVLRRKRDCSYCGDCSETEKWL